MITGLMHIAVYTKNMDETMDFYVNRLKFTNTWKGMVMTRNGMANAAVVKMGDCVLELVVPPDLGKVNRLAGPVQHFALRVQNMNETIEFLRSQGIEISEEPEDIAFEGGVRHCFIYGPSNERIELAERVPL